MKKPDRPPIIHFEYCLAQHGDEVRGERVPDGCITSISINDIWLYFYHENLVAIRHQVERWSYYIDLNDCKDVPPEFVPPSLERLHQVHLDIISRDFGGDENRTVSVLPLVEIGPTCLRLIGDELASKVVETLGVPRA